jgi:hypothetical protein
MTPQRPTRRHVSDARACGRVDGGCRKEKRVPGLRCTSRQTWGGSVWRHAAKRLARHAASEVGVCKGDCICMGGWYTWSAYHTLPPTRSSSVSPAILTRLPHDITNAARLGQKRFEVSKRQSKIRRKRPQYRAVVRLSQAQPSLFALPLAESK